MLSENQKIILRKKPTFDEIEKLISSLGGIVVEQDLLDHVSKDAEHPELHKFYAR